jgi:hypothetical protein
MDVSSVAAIVAAMASWAAVAVALIAIRPARRSAKASEEQTDIQRELARQSAQPYVWADIQLDRRQGALIHLVVGNSGPTVARNVRVTIDPPLPVQSGDMTCAEVAQPAEVAQRRLQKGILSLAPGRRISWFIGRGSELLQNENDTTVYKICVNADGPYGPIAPNQIEIRLTDWRESIDAPDGSLHYVREEIRNLVTAVKSLSRSRN